MQKLITHSKSQTQKFARELAQTLRQAQGKKFALVIALRGDLGAGKTTFAQGFLRGLGVRSKITSPTFIIFKKYKYPNSTKPISPIKPINPIKLIKSISPISPIHPIYSKKKQQKSKFKNIYHFDAYRIKSPKEISDLGFKELISSPQNIILIEWPERISKILPKKRIKICFEYGKKENERKIGII